MGTSRLPGTFDTRISDAGCFGRMDDISCRFDGLVETWNLSCHALGGCISKTVPSGIVSPFCSLSTLPREEAQRSAASNRFYAIRFNATACRNYCFLHLCLSMDNCHGILHILCNLEPIDAHPSHDLLGAILAESINSVGKHILSIYEPTLVSKRFVHRYSWWNGSRLQQQQRYSSEPSRDDTRISVQNPLQSN